MAARELSKARFMGPTRPVVNPVTSTVGTTATEILRNNPDRVQVLIVNLSAYDVYFGFDREVSTTRGIIIPSNGGSATLLLEEDGELVTYAIFAIASASATIYVVEVERI